MPLDGDYILSIEIDILLWKDTLWVGHDLKDLINKKSLVQQYLIPLDSIIRNNNNSPYADKGSKLQILIDIKFLIIIFLLGAIFINH